MKRIIALVLVLLLPCIAVAEQGDFQPEGEWYGAILYSERFSQAELDEGNCFHVTTWDGEVIYKSNGAIDYPEETIEAACCELSDDAILYYDRQDNVLFGTIFLYTDDEWRQYTIESTKMMLMIDEKVVPYQGGETASYLVSDDMMYIVNEDSYIRGSIRRFGECAFAVDIDADPYTVSFGERTVNYGIPFYLFISTSIGK